MMVLSSLLKTSIPRTPRRPSRSSPQHSSTSTIYTNSSSPEPSPKEVQENTLIHDESHISPAGPEDPDLRDLNHSLVALAAVFPDVQAEVFREMLSSFDEQSRLAVVTETLLKSQLKWVRGRYRVVLKDTAPLDRGIAAMGGTQELVLPEEKFRTQQYKAAVKNITYNEFKGLPRSTINAVLAESNHSYSLARPTLITLSSKSWRFSLSSLFLRRKPMSSLEAERHPLVIWQSTGRGSIVPTIKATGSSELDRELFESLLLPVLRKMQTEREEKDHALALKLNNMEAEANEALQECECCFMVTTFEETSACNDGGHLLCFECVRRAVNEAVFGQGWQRNIDLDSGSLRCLAATSDLCHGCIPQQLVRRAFCQQRTGSEALRKFDERLAEENLLRLNLPLIRCPFCTYAEVDELYLPECQRAWHLRRIGSSSVHTLAILIFGVGMIPFVLPLFILVSFMCLLLSSQRTFGDIAVGHLNSAVTRLRRKRIGLKFICQNESCRRSSCMSCSKAWNDIHVCHESSLVALRTQIELAMSLAIKRTCPRCNTSFVKSSGCNKLTCVCGYQMCYVCRKDIGNGEGYRHFCEHFRPNGGGGCTECTKCDLYRCEDDEVVVKKAKEEAESLWLEKEKTDPGGDEMIRKIVEENRKKGESQWWERWRLDMPRWEVVLDTLVDAVVE